MPYIFIIHFLHHSTGEITQKARRRAYLDSVLDFAGVVSDDEGGLHDSGELDVAVSFMLTLELVQQRLIGGLRETGGNGRELISAEERKKKKKQERERRAQTKQILRRHSTTISRRVIILHFKWRATNSLPKGDTLSALPRLRLIFSTVLPPLRRRRSRAPLTSDCCIKHPRGKPFAAEACPRVFRGGP